MLRQQITLLKQVNLQISLRIDWVPVKGKERSQDVFKAHRIGKTYFDKMSSKNAIALLLNLQHSGIAQ